MLCLPLGWTWSQSAARARISTPRRSELGVWFHLPRGIANIQLHGICVCMGNGTMDLEIENGRLTCCFLVGRLVGGGCGVAAEGVHGN